MLIKECSDYWSKLFWIAGKEDPSQYEAVKRFEVFEFFRILEIHEKSQDEKLNSLKGNKNGS
ncbi:MAG: hypothetical protein KC589_09170 [Nanoarchaeota archaeon]|nr:hypothetical protein [Nanoarchaeota archaeon]